MFPLCCGRGRLRMCVLPSIVFLCIVRVCVRVALVRGERRGCRPRLAHIRWPSDGVVCVEGGGAAPP